MTKAFVRYHNGVLAPVFPEDAEILATLRAEHDYMVTISVPRNLRFHRKFFALLRITLDNMPESICHRDNIRSLSSLLSAVKISAGLFDTVVCHGREIAVPRSISFAKMDEASFERFYNRVLDIILADYLVGSDRADISAEVESQFTSYRNNV